MTKIRGLDGIRALAALSVVFSHLHIFIMLENKGIISTAFNNSINGGSAVQAFFVLSGFLITHLLIVEYEANGKVSLYNFYIRRSLRIFPLYFLVVTMIGIAQLIGENVASGKSLLLAFFYLYNFVPQSWYSPVLGHTWSLAVEEHFYLVWPFIFISLIPRYRRLVGVLAILLIASFVVAVVLSDSPQLNKEFFVKRWTFVAGSNIALGALLAIAITGEKGILKTRTLLSTKIGFFFSISLIFSEIWLQGTNYFVTQYTRGIGFTLFIGWIVLNQNGLATRFLEIAPLQYLGKISYGIYMYQGFFLSSGPYRAPNQSWPPDQTIGLILLIIVTPLSYHYFEKPILSLKGKLQRNR